MEKKQMGGLLGKIEENLMDGLLGKMNKDMKSGLLGKMVGENASSSKVARRAGDENKNPPTTSNQVSRGNKTLSESYRETFASNNEIQMHRDRRFHHITLACSFCKRYLTFPHLYQVFWHFQQHSVTPTLEELQKCISIGLFQDNVYANSQYVDGSSSRRENFVEENGLAEGNSMENEKQTEKEDEIYIDVVSIDPTEEEENGRQQTDGSCSDKMNSQIDISYPKSLTPATEDSSSIVSSKVGHTVLDNTTENPSSSRGIPNKCSGSVDNNSTKRSYDQIENCSQVTPVATANEGDVHGKRLQKPIIDSNHDDKNARRLSNVAIQEELDLIVTSSPAPNLHMCPGCGTKILNYQSLVQHVASNCVFSSKVFLYSCPAADKTGCSFAKRKMVKDEREILNHLTTEHNTRVLQCLHCYFKFETKSTLLIHLQERHGIRCVDSNSIPTRKEIIKIYSRSVMRCDFCKITFPTQEMYISHIGKNTNTHINWTTSYKCANCFICFDTEEKLYKHIKQSVACMEGGRLRVGKPHSSGNIEQGIRQSAVPAAAVGVPVITPMVSSSPAVVNQPDVRPQEHMFVCPTNYTPQQNLLNLRSGYLEHKEISRVVSKNYASVSGSILPFERKVLNSPIQHHMQLHSTNIANFYYLPNVPAIQNCPKTVAVKAVNGITTPFHTGNISTNNNIIHCQFCERLVLQKSIAHHEYHCNLRDSFGPGFCIKCKQYFGDNIRLARHGVIHIKEGNAVCLICNNMTVRPVQHKRVETSQNNSYNALKNHIHREHVYPMKVFPCKCIICNESCPDKRTFENHLNKHHFMLETERYGDEPSPIPISNEQRRDMMKAHKQKMDAIQKKTVSVYFCPYCSRKVFLRERSLARHLTVCHQVDPNSLDFNLLRKKSSAKCYKSRTAKAN